MDWEFKKNTCALHLHFAIHPNWAVTDGCIVLQWKCEISCPKNGEYFLKPYVLTYVNKINIILLYYASNWQIKNQHMMTCRFKWVFHLCKLNSFHDTILVLGTKDELRSDWWSDLMNTNNCIIVTVNLHWQTLRVETMLNGKIRDLNPRWTNLKHKTQRKFQWIGIYPYSQCENKNLWYSI